MSRGTIGTSPTKEGREFEKLLEQMCLIRRVACTRVPDGCRVVGGGRMVRVKSPWDFVLSFEGSTALIDAKSYDDLTFQHHRINPKQIEAMRPHSLVGIRTGYIVHLREANRVVFVPSRVMESMNPGDSVVPMSPGVLDLGSDRQPNMWDPRRLFWSPQGLRGLPSPP